MPLTQHQAFCHRCNATTLHTREIEYPNHGLHWIIILFCCGFWIPFYVLLLAFPTKHPWMCARCGELLGNVPDDVKAAPSLESKRKIAVDSQKRVDAPKVSAQLSPPAHEGAPRGEDREWKRRESIERLLRTSRQSLIAAIRQAHRPLEWISGDDVFLLRIYQGLFGLLGVVIAGAGMFTVLKIVGLM